MFFVMGATLEKNGKIEGSKTPISFFSCRLPLSHSSKSNLSVRGNEIIFPNLQNFAVKQIVEILPVLLTILTVSLSWRSSKKEECAMPEVSLSLSPSLPLSLSPLSPKNTMMDFQKCLSYLTWLPSTPSSLL